MGVINYKSEIVLLLVNVQKKIKSLYAYVYQILMLIPNSWVFIFIYINVDHYNQFYIKLVL